MGLKRLYQAVSPYPEGAAVTLDYAQNVDVQYLAHAQYPLHKLVRYGHADWRFSKVTFGPTLATPAAPTVTTAKPNATGSFDTAATYAVTFVRSSSPAQESRISPGVTVTNDLTLQGNINTIVPPALPAGADRVVVYKKQHGAFGYIGYIEGAGSFVDGSPPLQPVLSETPPSGQNPFNAAGKYPSSVTFHQQRLVLGNTTEIVNGVWGSRSSDFENMDTARPAHADDALSFAFNTGEVNAVKHMLSMSTLLVFTGDAIFSVEGGDGNVMTPGDINPKLQSNRGCSRLKPLAVDTVAFFQPARGSSIRSLGYTYELEGYKTDEISIFSPHLFQGHGIIAWDYQEEPFSVVWAVRNDGVLLAFTWQLEQQVWGWTPMEVDGEVQDVRCIPEDGYTRVYILVKRTINGVVRRFVERMALPHIDDIATACHLDCSITRIYETPQGYADQLWPLEGATVSVVYDGYVSHGHVVTNGRVDLPNTATAVVISVGFPYQGRLVSLPPALMSQAGSLQTNRQQIGDIVVRAIDTRGIEIGAEGTQMEQVEPLDGGDVSVQAEASLVDHKITAQGDWRNTSGVVIEQNEPLPASIVGIFYDMKIGNG